jgi:Ca2+-transporting ATPase
VEPALGLRTTEARRRLARDGPNRLEEIGGAGPAALLGRQFRNPLTALLAGAASVALLVGEPADAVAILFIVLLNGAFGFLQEWKAERELDALRRILTPECTVRRDGATLRVHSTQVVVGDIVALEEGDRVPADLRLLEGVGASADEAVLTGESATAAKAVASVDSKASLASRSSMLWMGTALSSGRAVGVVVATGMRTEFGRVATLSQGIVAEPTPLQRRLVVFSRQLGIGSVFIAVAVAGTGWLAGRPLWPMLLTGVSLAVAVVPEGLPAVVTLTLAIGVRRLVRRGVLLRRLAAAEAIGGATVICTDKTGTLTANQMTVRVLWLNTGEVAVSGAGYAPEGTLTRAGGPVDPAEHPDMVALLSSAAAASRAEVQLRGDEWLVLGDPTEGALVTAARKAGIAAAGDPVAEIPFSSDRRRMTIVTGADKGALIAHCKGAPSVVLERCARLVSGGEELEIDTLMRQSLTVEHERLAAAGYRVLAVARRTLPAAVDPAGDAVEQEMSLLGFVGLIDPPRPEVRSAVASALMAGIRLHLVTGDAAGTAAAVAREIGLPLSGSFTGPQIDDLSDGALVEATARGAVLFARATPEHKLRIVRLLQASREVVGMTGDGVNDAPALKQADIGIAMGVRGTDVARGAADLVISDDNFASIIAAVREGRRQFDSIRRFVAYLLSSNGGEVLALLVNVMTGAPLILLPVQILWMNLVTDGATALALGLEPAAVDTMRRPPRSPQEQVLDRNALRQIWVYGLYIGTVTLVAFAWWRSDPASVASAQTAAFTVIILAEIFNVLNFRSGRLLDGASWRASPTVPAAIIVSLGLHVAAVHFAWLQRLLGTVPLSASDWCWALLLAVPIVLLRRLGSAAIDTVDDEPRRDAFRQPAA